MPFECARAICLTFCAPIAGALIPIFGSSFPSQCVPEDSPLFGRMAIDPRIIRAATAEANAFRNFYSGKAMPSTPTQIFSTPDFGSPQSGSSSSPLVSPRSGPASPLSVSDTFSSHRLKKRLRAEYPSSDTSSSRTSRFTSNSPEIAPHTYTPPTPVTVHHSSTTYRAIPTSSATPTALYSTIKTSGDHKASDMSKSHAPFRHLPVPARPTGINSRAGYTSTPANLKSYASPSSSSPHPISSVWPAPTSRTVISHHPAQSYTSSPSDDWSTPSPISSPRTARYTPNHLSLQAPTSSPPPKRMKQSHTYPLLPALMNNNSNNNTNTTPPPASYLQPFPLPPKHHLPLPIRTTQKLQTEDRQAALLLMKLSSSPERANVVPTTPLHRFVDVVLAECGTGGKRKRAVSV